MDPNPVRPAGPQWLSVLTWTVFGAFVVFLVVQHAAVFAYHDDWGLAVLDYVGEETGFAGQRFSLWQALHFLGGMYLNWTGRVSAFFFEVYLFKLGIWYVRAFQILTIVASGLLAVRTAAPRRWASPLVMIPPALYIALPREVLVGGIYWFSASCPGLWGLPLLLLAAALISSSGRLTWPAALFLAVSATFHEEMGTGALAFAATYVLLVHRFGRGAQTTRSLLLRFVPTACLAAATIFAPGNLARRRVSSYGGKNLLEVVLSNADEVARFLIRQGWLLLLVLLASLAVLWVSRAGWVRWPGAEQGRTRRGFMLTGLVTSAAALGLLLNLRIVGLGVLFLLFGRELYLRARQSETGRAVFATYMAALGSLAPLLVAPWVPGRSFIPFYFLCSVPICFAFSLSRGRLRAPVAVALCAIAAIGMSTALKIYSGYRSNLEVNLVNHYRLAATSFDLHHGASPVREIVLYKLVSPEYAQTMPYERPLIEKWMKKYYELPPEVSFVWR